jgi:hypothetical protein
MINRTARNLTIAALLVLGVSVASAHAASVRGTGHPVASRVGVVDSATLAACTTGAGSTDRSAHFTASMQALPRTRSMAISFDLYERTPGGAFAPVAAPGFGVWQSSNPGITSFTANEDVLDLPAPAMFRAVVHYRWLNRRRVLIRIDRRVTPACVETAVPTPQPDLFIVDITHSPGSPPATTEDYTVHVRNSGAGAAGSFSVSMSVGGTTLPEQTVSGLASATVTTVQFTGPRCTAGATLTATVDPAGAITEPADTRRTISIQCPSPGTGTSSSADTGSTGTTGATSTTTSKAAARSTS